MLADIVRDFLRKYDLASTWYYQEKNIAWAEYGIMRALTKDGYNGVEEAAEILNKGNIVLVGADLQKRAEFMSLDKKEDRLIFHQILEELLRALSAENANEQDYIAQIYDVFRAVAADEDEKKIKSFVDNFIYLPKCALLEYCADGEIDQELYQKLILSKPKLAKACFNQLFQRR